MLMPVCFHAKRAVCLLGVISFLSALFLVDAGLFAATDAPGPLTSAPKAGTTGVYTQINTSAKTFSITDSDITLTGGADGQLLVPPNKNTTVYVGTSGRNSTLTLTQGEFTGHLVLREARAASQNVARLVIGTPATGGRVTINGEVAGGVPAAMYAQGRTVHALVETNGAELIINGAAGHNPDPIGELRARSGNITIISSNSAQAYMLSAYDGMQIDGTQAGQFVIGALDLRGTGKVLANSLHFYNQINGGMDNQSLLHSNGDLWFMDTWSPGKGGMVNGAGTFAARTDIMAIGYNKNVYYPLTQADGKHLTLKAETGDIGASIISADTILAEHGSVIAGRRPGSGEISFAHNESTLFSPTGQISTSVITAQRIGAGELSAASVGSMPASVTATSNLLVVKSPTTSGNLSIKNGIFTLKGSNPVGDAEYGSDGAIIRHDEANYVGGDFIVSNSGQSEFVSLGVGGKAAIAGGSLDGETLNAGSVELKNIDHVKISLINAQDSAVISGAKLTGNALNTRTLQVNAGAEAALTTVNAQDSAVISGAKLTGNALNTRALQVNAGAEAALTTINAQDSAVISGAKLTGGTVGAATTEIRNGAIVKVSNLVVTDSTSGFLRIGDNGDTLSPTIAGLDSVTMNGRQLRIGAGLGQARAAIGAFVIEGKPGNMTDGDILVGHNGLLALNALDSSALVVMAQKAGVTDNAASLGVFAPVVLGGGLQVDAGWDNIAQGRMASRALARSENGIGFSDNSFLMINAKAHGVSYSGKPVATIALPASVPGAISSASPVTANVDNGAKIYLDGVTPGHTYVALGRNIITVYGGDTAWKGQNLQSSNPLLGLERLDKGMEGQFGIVEKAPEVKRIAASGGVARLTRAASEAMETAIFHRIKLGEEDLYRRSFALWALPIYESIHHFGLDAGSGSYGYDGGIGGLAIGGDYSWENVLRAGIALNMGAGYARSHGDTVTKNNLDFWGVGAYAVWKPGQFSLDADLNFTWSYDKLKQDLPADVASSQLKADVRAWSMGAGLRAEYEFDTEYLIIRPHFGVRYFHLEASPYDVSLSGHDVLHSKRSYQNVWTFPFGIVFTKNFRLGDDYELTPLVNLKAIPASGDIYVKNSVRYAGAHKGEEISTQVMDSITWGGRAGLEFRAGDFSVGVNYMAQFGSHTSNQGVFGVLRYEF